MKLSKCIIASLFLSTKSSKNVSCFGDDSQYYGAMLYTEYDKCTVAVDYHNKNVSGW